MKKTAIISILIIAFASINLFAEQKQKTEENNKTQQEWNEIGEQGKKALSEAGKFFSSAGKKVLSETEKVLNDTGKIINDSIQEIKTPQCYGKWIYKTNKSKTIIECKENGQMSVQLKSHGKTKKYSGVFTATAHTITFKIVKSNASSAKEKESWFITYSLQEDGETIKIQSMDIPEIENGVNFRSAVLFEKYHLFA